MFASFTAAPAPTVEAPVAAPQADQAATPEPLTLTPPEGIEEAAETVADEAPGAFELLAQQERQEGVRHCMDKLSAEHRECVHLVFYEGLGLADVAALQACPENTVKTRLFHARKKLANCLRLLLQREGGSHLAGAAP